jgi:YjbE family integral membrane protein
MLELLFTSQIWVDVFKIIMIDLLLSGDNAVVIALACRNLPLEQRKKGILFGVLGAIILRIVLTFFALSLLSLPYLKLAGALLLIWIGIKLILPEDEHSADNIQADTRLFGAVKTIIIADLVMSLDNVLGVAAAAKGNVPLLVFGLLISIPLIAWSSQLVLKMIDRFSVIIYAGGALLGYVAGEMLVSEALFSSLVETQLYLHWLVPEIGRAHV